MKITCSVRACRVSSLAIEDEVGPSMASQQLAYLCESRYENTVARAAQLLFSSGEGSDSNIFTLEVLPMAGDLLSANRTCSNRQQSPKSDQKSRCLQEAGLGIVRGTSCAGTCLQHRSIQHLDRIVTPGGACLLQNISSTLLRNMQCNVAGLLTARCRSLGS